MPPTVELGGKLTDYEWSFDLAIAHQEELRVGKTALQLVAAARLPVPRLAFGSQSGNVADPPSGEPIRFQVDEHAMPIRQADGERLDVRLAGNLEDISYYRRPISIAAVSNTALPHDTYGVGRRRGEARLVQDVPHGGKLHVEVVGQNAPHRQLHGRHFHPRHELCGIANEPIEPLAAEAAAQHRQVGPERFEPHLARHLFADGVAACAAEAVAGHQPRSGQVQHVVIGQLRRIAVGRRLSVRIDEVCGKLFQLVWRQPITGHPHKQPRAARRSRSTDRGGERVVLQFVAYAEQGRRHHGRRLGSQVAVRRYDSLDSRRDTGRCIARVTGQAILLGQQQTGVDRFLGAFRLSLQSGDKKANRLAVDGGKPITGAMALRIRPSQATGFPIGIGLQRNALGRRWSPRRFGQNMTRDAPAGRNEPAAAIEAGIVDFADFTGAGRVR